MSAVSKSGKHAMLFSMTKGSLIVGTGSLALDGDSWFMINAVASTSTLPYTGISGVDPINRIFKSPPTASTITPAAGDDVYPLTLTKICKADASISTEKGTIEVTDDCEGGYNAYIPDGFTDLSGSISAFMKYNDPNGGMTETQQAYLQRFFDIQSDDGAGVYSLAQKNDDDILLAILQNSDQVAVGDVQVWMLIPAILSSITLDKPLKGVQNFDSAWSKGQGPAAIYNRTTNATETVF